MSKRQKTYSVEEVLAKLFNDEEMDESLNTTVDNVVAELDNDLKNDTNPGSEVDSSEENEALSSDDDDYEQFQVSQENISKVDFNVESVSKRDLLNIF